MPQFAEIRQARALQEKSAMKRHLAWWIVFGLLALAWAPFGLDELSRPMNHGHAEDMYRLGFRLLVWWPCNILAILIILYKLIK